MKKIDDEGFTIVTIGDLVTYLSQFPQDAEVILDKDGWMQDEIPHETAVELVARRGAFQFIKQQGFLVINN